VSVRRSADGVLRSGRPDRGAVADCPGADPRGGAWDRPSRV